VGKKKVVVLGTSSFQEPLIQDLKALGYFVIGIDKNSNSSGRNICDYFVNFDIADWKSCLEVAVTNKVICAISVASEIASLSSSRINRSLGLPTNKDFVHEIFVNKLYMRRVFEFADIPIIRSQYFENGYELFDKANNLVFPLVMKPLRSAGSRGVTKVLDQIGLQYSLQEVLKYGSDFLIEDFVEGTEISIDGIFQDGSFLELMSSDKIRSEPPHLIDTFITFPSMYSREILSEACKIIEKVCKTSGVRRAVIHSEFLINSSGIFLVEMALRGAGFNVFSRMIPQLTGINTSELLLNLALGKKISISTSKLNMHGILAFPSFGLGKIIKIDDLNLQNAPAQLIEYKIHKGIGDTIDRLKSGSDRPAHLMIVSDNKDLCNSAYEKALENIKISFLKNQM